MGKLIRTRGVCEIFDNVTPRTVKRWRDDPRLGFPQPAVRTGRNDFYELDEILAYRRDRRPAPVEPELPALPALLAAPPAPAPLASEAPAVKAEPLVLKPPAPRRPPPRRSKAGGRLDAVE